MLSLYIHIPFCEQKCSYCSFFVVPENQNLQDLKEKYVNSLLEEIDYWKEKFWNQEIKTIFFGGWTPLSIGKENLDKILEKIFSNFDCSYLEELNFELNPNPREEVLDFVKFINKKYKKLFRIRYSFWIQSFDDSVLKASWRNYIFNTLVSFLRELKNYKEINNVFNFDFIAFWSFYENKKWELQLWDKNKFDFFDNFVNSMFADSFSLYMIELFPGSYWHDVLPKEMDLNEDNVYEEFSILKSIIEEAGYRRYEISNFSLSWKSCIHNRVYWNMENYLWLWVNSSSFLNQAFFDYLDFKTDSSNKGIRFKNTTSWKNYFNWNYIDENTIQQLDEKEYKKEEFFLRLRTDQWIENIDNYKDILVSDFKQKIDNLLREELAISDDKNLILTWNWMDIYNEIITELIEDL